MAVPDEPFRAVLTSAAHREDAWSITHREVAPDCPVPWSVRKATLHGGRQEGVDVVVVDVVDVVVGM